MLYWAAEERSLEVLRVLLKEIRKDSNLSYLIEETDRMDNTSLHVAAMKGIGQQLLIEVSS